MFWLFWSRRPSFRKSSSNEEFIITLLWKQRVKGCYIWRVIHIKETMNSVMKIRGSVSCFWLFYDGMN